LVVGSQHEGKGGPLMKLVRKIVIAVGSIAALMLAGGAHFKVN
jgi:hypothetical protein